MVRQNGATGATPGTGELTLGVAIGCRYVLNGAPTWSQYYPGGGTETEAYVFVCDSADQVYKIKCDAAVTQAEVGANYLVTDFAEADGSTSTGNSGINLDVGTAATTSSYAVRMLAIPKDGVNENSSTPNVIVRINWEATQLGQGTGIHT